MSTLKVNDIQEATAGGGKAFVGRAWWTLMGQERLQSVQTVMFQALQIMALDCTRLIYLQPLQTQTMRIHL